MKTVRFLLLMGVLLVACGSEGTPTRAIPPTIPPTSSPASLLNVTVDAGEGSTKQATLTCGDVSTGTGFLADTAAATAACQLVTGNAEAKLLVASGIPSDAICTQQYGGPQTATISGTLSGQTVNTTIKRNNGCGISAWDTLEALLGKPGS